MRSSYRLRSNDNPIVGRASNGRCGGCLGPPLDSLEADGNKVCVAMHRDSMPICMAFFCHNTSAVAALFEWKRMSGRTEIILEDGKRESRLGGQFGETVAEGVNN